MMPTKPKDSPMEARIKSVELSGTKRSCVMVPIQAQDAVVGRVGDDGVNDEGADAQNAGCDQAQPDADVRAGKQDHAHDDDREHKDRSGL